jgi:protein archease
MGLRKFRYLPHTADVAFVAYGRSFKTAMENSAQALLGVMFDMKEMHKEKAKTKTLRLTEEAGTRDELVWFTLQKIVSKVDEKGVSAFGFKVNHMVQKKDKIVLHGCVFYKKLRKYVALLDVKGVTPHDLSVKRGKNGYRIHVLLDV